MDKKLEKNTGHIYFLLDKYIFYWTNWSFLLVKKYWTHIDYLLDKKTKITGG